MEFMKEAFRQTAIVAISCVITLIVWLAIRLLLNQAHFQTSKIVDYILVILIYTAIRLGIKSRILPERE
jgi:nitrate reductase gamma subunit